MVHLRAKNLPAKGILKGWLFNGNEVNYGDDFAVIKTDIGDVIVKASVTGFVSRTIRIGTQVHNGSVLASIATNDREISKIKNRYLKITERPVDEPIVMQNVDDTKLPSAEDELDKISGAVIYDNNMMARTPFSQATNDIMTKPDISKIKNIEGYDLSKAASKEEIDNADNQPLDIFAKMRANISKSLENNPHAKKVELSEQQQQELSSIDLKKVADKNPEDFLNANNANGVSKLRQMVEARKNKLLEENEFKEIDEKSLVVSAMDKVDEDGKPLILRNIVMNRLKKFNESGGDVEFVNDPTKHLPKQNNLPKQIEQSEQEESPWTVSRHSPQKTYNEVSNTVDKVSDEMHQQNNYNRNNASDYDEENIIIDQNDLLSAHGAVIKPSKSKDALLTEINSKSNQSYSDSKISNLYDNSRRNYLLQTHNQRKSIQDRVNQIMNGELEIEERRAEFGVNPYANKQFREKELYNPTSRYNSINQKNYDTGNFNSNTLEKNVASRSMNNENMPRNNNEENFDVDKQIEIMEQKANIDPKTFSYLAKEIEDLKELLKTNNRLEAANVSLGSDATKTVDQDAFFSKMMQFMMMQQMLSLTKQQNTSEKDVKDYMNNYLSEFLLRNNLTMPQLSLQEQLANLNALNNHTNNIPKQQNQQFTEQPVTPVTQETKSESPEFKQPVTNAESLNTNIASQSQQTIIPGIQDKTLNENSIQKNKENIIDLNYGNVNDAIKLPPKLDEVITNNISNANRNDNDVASPKIISLKDNRDGIEENTFSITTEIDMTYLLGLKHKMKKQTKDKSFYSTISFLIKATSIVLNNYPKFNSRYEAKNNELIIKHYHNIGLVTETNDGILTPVIKFADKLSLKQIAVSVKDITNRLKTGELFNYETSGLTISLANYNKDTPIKAYAALLYPNVALLCIGKIVKKNINAGQKNVAVNERAMMQVSLITDKRVITQNEANEFLQDFKYILETPRKLVM